MSFIFNRIKGALTNFRTRFCGDDDANPYHHGIPGIPTDGRVVVLQNSKLGCKVYLVGTVHISKQSVETVKKIELCKERARVLMTCNLEDVTLFHLLCGSMLSPGRLCTKIGIFALNFSYHKLRADGIHPGMEFKVALEESARVGARCVLVDEDQNATLEKLSKVFSCRSLWKFLLADRKDMECTRSSVKELISLERKHHPEFFKVLVDDRDKYMFEKIRAIEKTVVVVVGMGHMEGIQLISSRL